VSRTPPLNEETDALAIEITHVRFADPEHKSHETSGFPSDTAYVGSGSNRRYLSVVESEEGSPSIRAHDDEGSSDDPLELPQF